MSDDHERAPRKSRWSDAIYVVFGCFGIISAFMSFALSTLWSKADAATDQLGRVDERLKAVERQYGELREDVKDIKGDVKTILQQTKR